MIRVVPDTNVLVSALLQRHGLPAEILLLTITGTTARLCVSGEIYSEYEDVIRRPRFKRSDNEIENALRAIRQSAIWVKPSLKVHACADPDDDVFLECALEARAHYLVTGNSRHFPNQWANTLIVNPRQFLDAVADVQDEANEP